MTTRRGTRGPMRLVLLLATFALVLAGCGGDGDGDVADGDGDGDVATEEDGDAATEGDGDAATEGDGDAAADMFAGELITLLVPFSPGGGYDTYSRLVAPFLAEELGAEVVVENQPGAGGLLALNTLWTAEPDGLTISIANGPGMVGSALGGAEGVEFDPIEFTYLGRLTFDPKLVTVGAETRWQSIDDLTADSEGFRIGATGPGASTFVDAELMLASLGISAEEIITGFEGSSEIAAAIIAGEVDSMVASQSSLLPPVENGDLRALAVVGAESTEELPDVPTIASLDLSEEGATIAQAHLALTESGRPIIAPPGMDEERAQVLQTALENVVANPDFLAEAEAAERPINFLDGPAVQELIGGLSDAPDAFLAVLRGEE